MMHNLPSIDTNGAGFGGGVLMAGLETSSTVSTVSSLTVSTATGSGSSSAPSGTASSSGTTASSCYNKRKEIEHK